MKCKLSEFALFNPTETLPKGTLAKKIPMDVLIPYSRDIPSYSFEKYNGGMKFRNNDTIMARITPCLENGKIAKVNILDDNEIAFGSTEYIVFRAIENISDPDFLYYLVTSSIVRDVAIKSMVGSSGRQRVQTGVLQNLSVSVPDLSTQRKIAAVLKSLDDKIELNNKINENLEQQAQAIFKSWFVDNPINCKQGVLSDIAQITMGQSPNGESYNEDGNGTVFFQGRAEFTNRFPTKRLYTTEPNRMAKTNDILLSVRAPVGDCNIAFEDCCIGRGLAAISAKDNFNSFVLYTVHFLKKQLDVFNGEGTVFGCINSSALNNLQVLIPPKETMDKFERLVASMDATIRNNYKMNCHLSELRDSLLPKLMSGEIDVSNVKI